MRRAAVFAKWPLPGRVKTRLAPVLSAELACQLYRAMLEDTLVALAACRADQRFLFWADAPAAETAPPETAGTAGRRLPAGLEARDQRGPDLGTRLERAFAELLREPEDRAVIVGADCPALDPETLDAALQALGAHPVVIGPTADGGYYLIGLGRPAPALFREVAWSTPRVLEQTIERARASGLEIAMLDRRDDLDTPEDLLLWMRRGLTAGALPAHSREALRAMALLPPG